MLRFQLLKTHLNARLGKISTAHGDIQTPVFMPVGTQATVKGMLPRDIRSTGAEIVLANTYHLMLRPSAEIVHKLGGLHKFSDWPHPILTDSGGFQVMSLSSLRKITEDGVTFSSHIDGSKHLLTPERATEIQYLLDSDISMVLDECTPYPISYENARLSMELTSRWAKRSREVFVKRPGYGQFGIVQGSEFKDLRITSADYLRSLDFEGYAIGGMGVEASQQLMFDMIGYCIDILPLDKPRYLMGVGKPSDIIGAVKMGIDMFDCVLPTRAGRHGKAYTKRGSINVRNAKFKEDCSPLEEDCICPTCSRYSIAYLRHLFMSKEMLGPILLTWHNIQYFQDLMKRVREYIDRGKDIDFTT